MKLFENIIDKIDDKLNPIVVKELRQAVQSRFVVGLLTFLLVVFLTVMIFFVPSGMPEAVSLNTAVNIGRRVFGILFGFFVFSSMLFVPAYTATRMVRERSGDNLDLVYISAVSPGVIIRGKLFASMIIILLLFSACLPFMSFTYLLRGVDLLSVFIIVAMAFFAAGIATQIALFIACIPCSRVFRSVLGLITAGAGFSFCSSTVGLADHMLRTGVGSRLGSWDFWKETSAVFILASFFTGFIYVLSVAVITPLSANRALGIRLYITFAWLVTGIMSFFSDSGIETWFVFYVTIMGMGLLAGVCEKDEQSPRVAHTIPCGKIKRTAAFFFYSGSANGIAWSLIMAGLTFFAALSFGHMFVHSAFSRHDNDLLYMAALFFLYHYCHTVSGLLITRKLLWKWIQPKGAWTVVMALYAASFTAILWNLSAHWYDILGSGFSRYILDKEKPGFAVPGLWAAIVTVLSLPWFVRQVRRFVPPQ